MKDTKLNLKLNIQLFADGVSASNSTSNGMNEAEKSVVLDDSAGDESENRGIKEDSTDKVTVKNENDANENASGF